jgi:hypothetical protein
MLIVALIETNDDAVGLDSCEMAENIEFTCGVVDEKVHVDT